MLDKFNTSSISSFSKNINANLENFNSFINEKYRESQIATSVLDYLKNNPEKLEELTPKNWENLIFSLKSFNNEDELISTHVKWSSKEFLGEKKERGSLLILLLTWRKMIFKAIFIN